ncbi:MAG: hypothetical protein AAFR11_00690 [Pseudomonadota bacterium]
MWSRAQFAAIAFTSGVLTLAGSESEAADCPLSKRDHHVLGAAEPYRDAVFVVEIAQLAPPVGDAGPLKTPDDTITDPTVRVQLTATLVHTATEHGRPVGYFLTALHDLGGRVKFRGNPNSCPEALKSLNTNESGRKLRILWPKSGQGYIDDNSIELPVVEIICDKSQRFSEYRAGNGPRLDAAILKVFLDETGSRTPKVLAEPASAPDGFISTPSASAISFRKPLSVRFDAPQPDAEIRISGYGRLLGGKSRELLSDYYEDDMTNEIRYVDDRRFQSYRAASYRIVGDEPLFGALPAGTPLLGGVSGASAISDDGRIFGVVSAYHVIDDTAFCVSSIQFDDCRFSGEAISQSDRERLVADATATTHITLISHEKIKQLFADDRLGRSRRTQFLTSLISDNAVDADDRQPALANWRDSANEALACMEPIELLHLHAAFDELSSKAGGPDALPIFKSYLAAFQKDAELREARSNFASLRNEFAKSLIVALAEGGLHEEAADVFALFSKQSKSFYSPGIGGLFRQLLQNRLATFGPDAKNRRFADQIYVSLDAAAAAYVGDAQCERPSAVASELLAEYGKILQIQSRHFQSDSATSVGAVFATAAACDPSNPAPRAQLALLLATNGDRARGLSVIRDFVRVANEDVPIEPDDLGAAANAAKLLSNSSDSDALASIRARRRPLSARDFLTLRDLFLSGSNSGPSKM